MWQIVNTKYKSSSAPTKPQTKKKLHNMVKKDDHKKHVQYLNDDEKAAIYLYTLNGLYQDFNKICRIKDANEINIWKPFGVNMIKALKKLPYYWGKVYRGQSYIPLNFEQQYQKNCVVCWDSFSSTSKTKSVAEAFAGNGILFQIKTWHGRYIFCI